MTKSVRTENYRIELSVVYKFDVPEQKVGDAVIKEAEHVEPIVRTQIILGPKSDPEYITSRAMYLLRESQAALAKFNKQQRHEKKYGQLNVDRGIIVKDEDRIPCIRKF